MDSPSFLTIFMYSFIPYSYTYLRKYNTYIFYIKNIKRKSDFSPPQTILKIRKILQPGTGSSQFSPLSAIYIILYIYNMCVYILHE